VQRTIVDFHQDDQGERLATLACGNERHVRHRPPLFPGSWVLEAEGGGKRIGTPLECGLCDQGGEAACFANLVCPDCGVLLDGSPHRPGCASNSVPDTGTKL